MASTLYRSGDAFYLIPDDVTPTPGPLELQALSGGHLEVDPLAVTPFRVTASVAHAFARRAASHVANRLESTVASASGALEALRTDDAVPDQAFAALSAQLQDLVGTFQNADLSTEDGRAAVERKLEGMKREG